MALRAKKVKILKQLINVMGVPDRIKNSGMSDEEMKYALENYGIEVSVEVIRQWRQGG